MTDIVADDKAEKRKAKVRVGSEVKGGLTKRHRPHRPHRPPQTLPDFIQVGAAEL